MRRRVATTGLLGCLLLALGACGSSGPTASAGPRTPGTAATTTAPARRSPPPTTTTTASQLPAVQQVTSQFDAGIGTVQSQLNQTDTDFSQGEADN